MSNTMIAQKLQLTPHGFVDSKNSDKDYVVLKFDGLTMSELYKKTYTYLSSLYVKPKEVISYVEGSSISIKAIHKKSIKPSNGGSYDAHYVINLAFKDGKIKFTFSNLYATMGSTYKTYISRRYANNEAFPLTVFNRKGIGSKMWVPAFEVFANSYISNLKSGVLADDDW